MPRFDAIDILAMIGTAMAMAYILTTPIPAKAQTTYYQDAYGRPIGSATTMMGNTYYSDGQGRPLGSSTTMDLNPSHHLAPADQPGAPLPDLYGPQD